ncbi:endocuticle structural glycoprotein ABD-5-like [Anticarsia gemmatalis]|uniref:endocuticle structural glycoprotein ABD-5-like n=1 Tax=Anticarsia gemmatalis TaxID=129554 RepID=UPI003F75B54E
MHRFIVLCALLALTVAAVLPEDKNAEIVKYESSNDGAGNYKFTYETSNGITRQEVGHLVNAGTEDEHMVVEGSYSYTDVEGKLVVIRYTADENGYQVSQPEQPIQVVSGVSANVVASLLGK